MNSQDVENIAAARYTLSVKSNQDRRWHEPELRLGPGVLARFIKSVQKLAGRARQRTLPSSPVNTAPR